MIKTRCCVSNTLFFYVVDGIGLAKAKAAKRCAVIEITFPLMTQTVGNNQ